MAYLDSFCLSFWEQTLTIKDCPLAFCGWEAPQHEHYNTKDIACSLLSFTHILSWFPIHFLLWHVTAAEGLDRISCTTSTLLSIVGSMFICFPSSIRYLGDLRNSPLVANVQPSTQLRNKFSSSSYTHRKGLLWKILNHLLQKGELFIKQVSNFALCREIPKIPTNRHTSMPTF